MTIQRTSLLLLLVARTLALFCALYDHSSPTVQCTSSCPSSTTQVAGHCLGPYMYIVSGQVHTCQGYVSADRTVCCPRQYYLSNNQCLPCRGSIYNNGLSCCTDDNYMDYSAGQTNCQPLTTGNCSELKFNSLFKFCCPQGQLYNVATRQCQATQGLSCDTALKVCCPLGQQIQFLGGSYNQYQCLNQCSWAPQTSTLLCLSQYCNAGTPISTGRKNSSGELLALGGQCCYGLSLSSACVTSVDQCLSRVVNRGWAVCCPAGSFYSAATQQCSRSCEGTVLFSSICLSIGKALDFSGSRPVQTALSAFCNGRVLSPLLPVCCPAGFFISDSLGCRLCEGNIFTLDGRQLCCTHSQYYDSTTQQCKACLGTIDSSGQICCPSNYYISYDTNGVASCAAQCELDNLYNNQYCCAGMTQGCKSTFVPTTCNEAYYSGSACQNCPGFCGGNDLCGISSQEICKKTCPINQVYVEGAGCLECHPNCRGCTRPIDATACLSCSEGYMMSQSQCQVCQTSCLTCSTYTSSCTSCRPSMVLMSSKCLPSCLDVGYYLDPYKLTCLPCSSSCLQCSTSSSTCSSCISSRYLNQGQCLSCDYSCQFCMSSARTCLKCLAGYSRDSSSYQCNQQCIGVVVQSYINGGVCLSCHPECNYCEGMPQNCTSCSGQHQYLDTTLGIGICQACIAPCIDCKSVTVCLSCLDGYYLQGSSCQPCDSSCATCKGPSTNDCLSCFGKTQLTPLGYCSGCSDGCLVCQTSTCTNCSSQYQLYQGKCVSSCPVSTYPSDRTCLPCDSSCQNCNSTTCLACKQGFVYTNKDKCYVTCPQNYAPSGTTCIENSNVQPQPPPGPPPTPTPTPTPTPSKNNTIATKSGPIVDQAILVKGDMLYINVYFKDSVEQQLNMTVNLVDKQGNRMPLTSSVVDRINNKVQFSAQLPNGQDLSSYSLVQTEATGNNINSTLISSQPSGQLVLSSITTDTLSNLKVFGYVFSAIILLFIVLAKIKGHFSAEEANTIVMHTFNFGQVCYLFKYASKGLDAGAYFFLNGFGIAHLSFFPSFFSVPNYYIEIPFEKSLLPDGNLIRNAGHTFSHQLIVIGITAVALLASVLYSRSNSLPEYVHFRKILRLGILFLQLGFMNELFFAFVQLIQPCTVQSDYKSYYDASLGLSYMVVFLVPLVMTAVIYHYYQTYNSDVLEHFYTLRQASMFFYIYGQSIIMCLAVGKPLVALFLLPLEAVWFVFNFLLYRYGIGLTLSEFKKYFIISGLISLSYLFLSLEEKINWVGLVVIVSLSTVALIVYSGYQLVGIYYFRIFRNADKGHHQN